MPHSLLRVALRLLRFATPISISLAVGASIALVDSLLVAPLGDAALAAIALGGSVTLVIIATIYGLMSMVGIRMAEADGANNSALAAREFTNGLVLAICAGGTGALSMLMVWPLLPALGQPPEVLHDMSAYWFLSSVSIVPTSVALTYRLAFEAFQAVWLGTALVLLTVLLNAAFGIVLIHGYLGAPALGLTGAGLATLLANLVVLAVSGRAACFARLDAVAFVIQRLSWSTFWAQTKSGAPAGLQYLLETGVGMAAMLMVGLFGTIALAANQIVSAVAMTVYMIPLGIAAATGLSVARLRGEGRTSELRPLVFAALLVVTFYMGSAAAIFCIFGADIAFLFSANTAVIASASALFVVFACMQIIDGIQSVTIGALRGFHDVGVPAIITSLCLWFLGLPMAFLVGNYVVRSPSGIWTGVAIGLLAACLILFFRFMRVEKSLRESGRQAE